MKLDAVAADACLDAVVERYRVAFTRHCTCGDPECAQPRIAAANDYRVVSCSMFATSQVALAMLKNGNRDAAVELLEATRRFAEPALTDALAAETELMESDVMDHLASTIPPTEQEMFDSIRSEIVETMPETPALDPEEIDHLWVEPDTPPDSDPI